jgi:ketosteroid isomerase-like protein
MLTFAAAVACHDPTPPSEPTTTNKRAVQIMLDAWSHGDPGALQRLLSDDVEWTIAGRSAVAGTMHGRAELIAKVLGPFAARFSASSDKFRPRAIRGVFGDGDTVIAHFQGAGVTNDGSTYANSYVWLLTLRDGKVVRVTAFFDSIAFDELWKRAI